MLQALCRFVAVLLLSQALPALAQLDPPARVGRLAHFENEAIFRVDRSDRGEAATINWPISSGAIIETGRHGRAEVWVGSTAYRLGDDSQVEFSTVDDTRVVLRVNGGTLAVSILDADQVDDVVVATPEGDIRFQSPGRYRIDVFDDRSTLTAQAGRASFAAGGRVMPVGAGQMGSRWRDGGEQLTTDRQYDAFDSWVAARENATLATQTRRHVSTHMTGYADLDRYGDWQTAHDYGTVWYPRSVAADWAPYRHGRWAWVAPWGWTWIDASPWGFAPFHYGRWALIGGRWAWVPGRIVARPVYAPALVAWVGNPGWSVSFGFGSAPAVGWFPLAPREVYVPAYRYSPTYIRQINVTHIHDVHRIERAARPDHREQHAYRDKPRALTVVPAQTLREGRPISREDIRQPERRELERLPHATSAPGAAWVAPPTRSQASTADAAPRFGERPRRDSDGRPWSGAEAGRHSDSPRRDSPMDVNRDRPGERWPETQGRREQQPGGPDMPRERGGRAFERSSGAVDGERGLPPVRREAAPAEARPAGPQILPDQPGEIRREAGRRAFEGRPDGESRGRWPGQAPQREFPDSQRQERPVAQPVQPAVPTPAMRQEERPLSPVPPQAAPRSEMPAPALQRDPKQPPFERDSRREMGDVQRQERSAVPVAPQAAPPVVPAPIQPQPMPRRDLPAPEMRPQERPQPVEREMRREMPVFQRQERPAAQAMPPVIQQPAPQAVPQREQARPMPEMRMPAAQPQPRMEAPRFEPPRQPAPPSGGNEPRRNRNDERGPR